jgi:hypothetical protein
MTIRVLFCLSVLLIVLGCRENKMTGPEPTIPTSSTKLLFSDCEPLNHPAGYADAVTLVADSRLACSGSVDFFSGDVATWHSDVFHTSPGTYSEGLRVVLQRPMSETQQTAVFRIVFYGVAASFSRDVTIGIGQTQLIQELSESGVLAADTTASISLTIQAIQGSATLVLGGTSNTYVFTEVSRSNLCELRIDQGLTGGVGLPNQGLSFSIANGGSGVWDSLAYDFTRGAVVTLTGIQFGPQFGPVYVMAGNEQCRDTAAFWALATSQHYRPDTLGYYRQGNILSDGSFVWFYDIYQPSHDSIPCAVFRVRWPNGLTLFNHPVYNCSGVLMSAEYDQQRRTIWIVADYASSPDTAWGYTTDGRFTEAIPAAQIPSGHIYHGRWVQQDGVDRINRNISVSPLAGGSTQVLGSYPTELTEGFSGAAGISRPGAGKLETYAINIFDAAGNWTDRYPVVVGDQDVLYSVSILTGDSVIVYTVTGEFASYGLGQQVRALRPR